MTDARKHNPEQFKAMDDKIAEQKRKQKEKCKSMPEAIHVKMETRTDSRGKWDRKTCRFEK